MRVLAYITVYFLPILCWGQKGDRVDQNAVFEHYLTEFVLTDAAQRSDSDNLNNLLKQLDRKYHQARRDVDFLSHLFSKVHYKFLKRYENYASFSELLENGSYNCLTGTALYALLLERYGYDYAIVETTYHIFLLIENDGGQILFEATDPQNGFVTDKEAIAERIRQYREDQIATSDESTYHFNTQVYNLVSLSELKGLLFYNMAVDAFNQQQFERSLALLRLAAHSYSSNRIQEFGLVIMQTLVKRDLRTSEKVSGILEL